MKKTLVVVAAVLALSSPAFACGGFGQPPCMPQPQLPTTVNPTFGGGYQINTPGRLPTTVNPTFGGGMQCN
jgi:hypothetical protein